MSDLELLNESIRRTRVRESIAMHHSLASQVNDLVLMVKLLEKKIDGDALTGQEQADLVEVKTRQDDVQAIRKS